MLLTRRWNSTRCLALRSIPIDSTRTTVMSSPKNYLDTILALIDTSQYDITLSALYFGTGEPERRILAAIERALNDPKRPNLKCTFIVDHSRATRISSGGGLGSLYNFLPLLKTFGKRAKVLLYRMSNYSGMFKSLIPQELCEVLGVYHCKFCVFDENVILTGANLSEEYLVNRQDRYILVAQDFYADKSEELLQKKGKLPLFLKSFVRTLDPYCCNVTFDTNTASEVEREKGGGERRGKDRLLITEPIVQVSSVDNSLSKQLRMLLDEVEDVEERRSDESDSAAVRTTLIPLVQHSTCGVLDESNHLLDLLFASSRSKKLEKNKENAENRDELVQPSTPYTLCAVTGHEDMCNLNHNARTEHTVRAACTITTAPVIGHDASSSVTDSSDYIGGWSGTECSNMVIASPYPSYTYSFTTSLLARFLSLPSTVSPISQITESIGPGSNDSTNMKCKKLQNIGHEKIIGKNFGRDLRKSLKFIVSEERSHGFFQGKGLKYLIPKMHSYALQSVLLQTLENIPQYQNQISRNQSVLGQLHRMTDSSTRTEKDNKEKRCNKTLKEEDSEDKRNDEDEKELGISDLNRNVTVHPYYRSNWTFHVKGIWLFKSRPMKRIAPENLTVSDRISANAAVSSRTPLAATYIGSSNFGERSCVRDFELGFVLHTDCPVLTDQLAEECSIFEEHSSDLAVGVVDYCAEAKRAHWSIPFLTKLLRSYL